jgi:hypothetical protein
MDTNDEHRLLPRRRWLVTAAAAGLCIRLESKAFGAEFWSKKDPALWTTEEILLLITKSPWARDTRVDRKAKGHGALGEEPEIDPSTDPSNGSGRGGGTPTKTQIKAPSVTVTWESAQPLLDALRYPIPADFADHYVIGVKNLPIIVEVGSRRLSQEELLDWLKNSATLRTKSKEPVQAGVVVVTRGGSMVLFGFLKELLPLTRTDRDVTFTLNTDQLAIKARFDPKEMIYRGKLAL